MLYMFNASEMVDSLSSVMVPYLFSIKMTAELLLHMILVLTLTQAANLKVLMIKITLLSLFNVLFIVLCK